ncbi:hypothetical protein [Oryzifoliimicrobium ureilyticus]|uniref:hypothetical protein n=1 Tax=Oryzifoliimicrobium ureilyticus TaxID=3113724 RepID=UPI0030761C16
MNKALPPIVAYCNNRSPAETQKVSTTIASLLKSDVRTEQAPGLAGPNDFVQVMLDAAKWWPLAILVKPFFEGFLGSAGEDAWKALKGLVRKTPQSTDASGEDLTTLYVSLNNIVQNGETVSLGFPTFDDEDYYRQNGRSGFAIEFSEPFSPEEFGRAIVVLSRVVPDLERAISGEFTSEEPPLSLGDQAKVLLEAKDNHGSNSDMSSPIHISKSDGSIYVRTHNLRVLLYTGQGERIWPPEDIAS